LGFAAIRACRRDADEVSEMPSHFAGRAAIVIGIAAILLFIVAAYVPPSMQVLVAILSLPIGASLFASATAAPRRRIR
jgi:hypothetical protein